MGCGKPIQITGETVHLRHACARGPSDSSLGNGQFACDWPKRCYYRGGGIRIVNSEQSQPTPYQVVKVNCSRELPSGLHQRIDDIHTPLPRDLHIRRSGHLAPASPDPPKMAPVVRPAPSFLSSRAMTGHTSIETGCVAGPGRRRITVGRQHARTQQPRLYVVPYVGHSVQTHSLSASLARCWVCFVLWHGCVDSRMLTRWASSRATKCLLPLYRDRHILQVGAQGVGRSGRSGAVTCACACACSCWDS